MSFSFSLYSLCLSLSHDICLFLSSLSLSPSWHIFLSPIVSFSFTLTLLSSHTVCKRPCPKKERTLLCCKINLLKQSAFFFSFIIEKWEDTTNKWQFCIYYSNNCLLITPTINTTTTTTTISFPSSSFSSFSFSLLHTCNILFHFFFYYCSFFSCC